MRIIKFLDQEVPEIEVIPEKDIQTEYNVNGLYYRDENFAENLEKAKNWEGDFGDFQYDDSRGECRYGYPTEFVEYTDDEWMTDPDGYFNADGDPVEIDDLDQQQYIDWWDGGNFRKVYVKADHILTDDLTEELKDSFTGKIFIGRSEESNIRWENYYWDGNHIWQENVTLWQGTRNTWELWENQDDIDAIFLVFGKDMIDKYRPNVWSRYSRDYSVKVSSLLNETPACYLSPSQIWDIE